ncbi:hypothetical protein A3N95_08500 [Mycobacteroides abscessus]|nr:hypothetical protein A3N95_08500 [Mycobacteroides abscessus]
MVAVSIESRLSNIEVEVLPPQFIHDGDVSTVWSSCDGANRWTFGDAVSGSDLPINLIQPDFFVQAE